MEAHATARLISLRLYRKYIPGRKRTCRVANTYSDNLLICLPAPWFAISDDSVCARPEATSALGKQAAKDIPGAKLVEIFGAGHVLHVETPELFEKALLEFTKPPAADAKGKGGFSPR